MYGGSVPEIEDISDAAKAKADEKACHVLSFSIMGRPEQIRAARVTRIGLIQNMWPSDTSAPIADQTKKIQTRIGDMVDAAGEMGVKVRPTHLLKVGFVWCVVVESATLPVLVSLHELLETRSSTTSWFTRQAHATCINAVPFSNLLSGSKINPPFCPPCPPAKNSSAFPDIYACTLLKGKQETRAPGGLIL
jgi:hypothetical protein